MKASSAYLLLTIGFLALLLLSKRPEVGHSRQHHRRHGPRAGPRIVLRKPLVNPSKHQASAFDPVVAEYEQRHEDRVWERQQFRVHQAAAPPALPHAQQQQHDQHERAAAMAMQPQPDSWEDEVDYFNDEDEDYLNDDTHFNITQRLLTLFPLLDVLPADNFVSLGELESWHVKQGLKASRHRSDLDFSTHDANHDGRVSFAEYLPELTQAELLNNSMEHGGAGWWKEHFNLADEDGDGALNDTEYHSFLNPEDSTNPKLHMWLRKQEILDHDTDKDGKLSWAEFDKGLFGMLREYGKEDGLSPEQKASLKPEDKLALLSQYKFAALDKDRNGFLTEDELEPVMQKLHPGEAFYAKQQAEQLMEQADDNKDGKLSVQEMLAHPYAFYSTAYDDGEDDYSHFELR